MSVVENMIDIRNDDRRSDNRYQINKHKILDKKQERYWIKRAKTSWNRFPAPSNTKELFSRYDEFEDDNMDIQDNFNSIEDELAFQLCHLVYRNDIDQLENLRLYLPPKLFGRLINTFALSKGSLYPIPTPMMVAASWGNDKLVQMFLEESSSIDVNLKLDMNIELNINKNADPIDQTLYHCQFQKTMNCICQYCESEIGTPALWAACYNGHLNVVRTLIEIGKADVNLPDHKNYTPLQAAIFNKHFDIVKYLIEQANVVIDETRDLFIAIQSESYDIVDYLLEKGCDPNTRLIDQSLVYIQPNYTFFALHYAIDYYSGDLSIIRTLLKHGGDPTIKDDQGRTALHIAIRDENEEIIKEILQYGYKHDQRDNKDLTPLMLALNEKQTNIINLLYETLPRQQYIDELMLLGSYYVLRYELDFFAIYPEAFEYFEQGLKLQQPNSDVLLCDTYLFQKECATIDELINIQNNAELMYIQGLLVYERLLPSRNEIHLLIPKLIDFSNTYLNIEQFDRSFSILTYVYPMISLCQETLRNEWIRRCFSIFIHLLSKLIVKEKIDNMEKIVQVFEWIFDQSNNVEQIANLCIYITYLIIIYQINNEYKFQLMHLIKQIVHKVFYVEYSAYTLFYQVVWSCLSSYISLIQEVSPENVVRLLIKCGANVDDRNLYDGRRPLHLVTYIDDIERAQSICEVLIAAGAHTDCRDHKGLLPEEYTTNIKLKEYLRSKRSMSLKCQCAHLIISKKIEYNSYLTESLQKFILMHQGQ